MSKVTVNISMDLLDESTGNTIDFMTELQTILANFVADGRIGRYETGLIYDGGESQTVETESQDDIDGWVLRFQERNPGLCAHPVGRWLCIGQMGHLGDCIPPVNVDRYEMFFGLTYLVCGEQVGREICLRRNGHDGWHSPNEAVMKNEDNRSEYVKFRDDHPELCGDRIGRWFCVYERGHLGACAPPHDIDDFVKLQGEVCGKQNGGWICFKDKNHQGNCLTQYKLRKPDGN
jgi:hypothetical protein